MAVHVYSKFTQNFDMKNHGLLLQLDHTNDQIKSLTFLLEFPS